MSGARWGLFSTQGDSTDGDLVCGDEAFQGCRSSACETPELKSVLLRVYRSREVKGRRSASVLLPATDLTAAVSGRRAASHWVSCFHRGVTRQSFPSGSPAVPTFLNSPRSGRKHPPAAGPTEVVVSEGSVLVTPTARIRTHLSSRSHKVSSFHLEPVRKSDIFDGKPFSVQFLLQTVTLPLSP